jgi:hypothetical protein
MTLTNIFGQEIKSNYDPDELAKFKGLKFGNVDYFATGEGRLTIYYCSTEEDDAKFANDFQQEMKVDDYFMICFEITKPHEILNTYPKYFLDQNEYRTSGFGAFQTYQNLS